MKTKIALLILSAMSVLTIACNKDDDNSSAPDDQSQITFSQPVPGLTYINGSTLQVRGNILDNDGLSASRLEIRNTASGAVLYQQNNPTANVTYYDFAYNWTVTGITGITNATVKITATDRKSNQVSEEINIVLSN